MSEIVHADIFFFITSLCVVLVTAGILIFFYYLIPIARDIRAIVAKARKAGDEIEQDFEALRATIREEGGKGKAIIDLALGFVLNKLRSSPRRRARKQESSSEE
jgi:hypothetical protein